MNKIKDLLLDNSIFPKVVSAVSEHKDNFVKFDAGILSTLSPFGLGAFLVEEGIDIVINKFIDKDGKSIGDDPYRFQELIKLMETNEEFKIFLRTIGNEVALMFAGQFNIKGNFEKLKEDLKIRRKGRYNNNRNTQNWKTNKWN